jgi:hypothetical protein
MLYDSKSGSVKGVAVKSEWITDMLHTAKLKFGDGADTGSVIKKDGISFSEHLVFMLVLPIRFANLKAVDVGTVSYVWYIYVSDFYNVFAYQMCYYQVLSTYNVRDLFREALSACKDITQTSYPLLSENKKKCKTSGNLSKLTQQSLRRMIILVARIYLADDIVRCLSPHTLPGFNFETYPVLKNALDTLENRLEQICESSSGVATKSKSAIELLQSIENDVRVAKQRLVLAETATRQALESLKMREVYCMESEIESRVEKRLEFMLDATKRSKKQKTTM